MDPMFRYFLGFQVAADRAGWLARPLFQAICSRGSSRSYTI